MARGYALAWMRNKTETCSGCGTRPDEWSLDEHAYLSDHWTCEGCARLAEEKSYNLDRSGPEGSIAPGQHVYLRPRPPD
jgi:hypothetical protein